MVDNVMLSDSLIDIGQDAKVKYVSAVIGKSERCRIEHIITLPLKPRCTNVPYYGCEIGRNLLYIRVEIASGTLPVGTLTCQGAYNVSISGKRVQTQSNSRSS